MELRETTVVGFTAAIFWSNRICRKAVPGNEAAITEALRILKTHVLHPKTQNLWRPWLLSLSGGTNVRIHVGRKTRSRRRRSIPILCDADADMRKRAPTKRFENVSGRCLIAGYEQLDTRARGVLSFTLVELSEEHGIRKSLGDCRTAGPERVTANANKQHADDHDRGSQQRCIKESRRANSPGRSLRSRDGSSKADCTGENDCRPDGRPDPDQRISR